MRILTHLRRGLRRAAKARVLRAIREKLVGQIDGVEICDLVSTDLQKSDFLRPTIKAMALIKKFDPIRYRRVCQRIQYIVNRPLISAGNYVRDWRICNVDYNKHYASGQPEWKLRAYACLLVHEATHGLLEDRGIEYNKATRARIEELCCLEEYRFAKRVDEWWADEYRSPKRFDATMWRVPWGSLAERRRARLRRIEEQREEVAKRMRQKDRERRYELLKKQGKRLF
jgi:hypothetical protein